MFAYAKVAEYMLQGSESAGEVPGESKGCLKGVFQPEGLPEVSCLKMMLLGIRPLYIEILGGVNVASAQLL